MEWQRLEVWRLLRAGEVRVVRVSLRESEPVLGLLSTAELERLRGIRHEEAARQFGVMRGMLRRCLGAELGVPPIHVPLLSTPRGTRPRLDAACDLSFSVSHSGEWGLLAFARGRAVGVDVETMRPDRDVMPVARRFFGAEEAAHLAALSPAAQAQAFYSYWVCKEAVLKGEGLGVAGGLDRVRIAPDGPGWREAVVAGSEGTAWRVCGIPLQAGMLGAVAVGGGEAVELELYEADGGDVLLDSSGQGV